MGRQEAEGEGDKPPRFVAARGLAGPQGRGRGRGELTVEVSDTELRSSRSVTDTDSSPGLGNEERK